MARYTITVNHNLCVGSTLCVRLLPGVFRLNEKGQSVVITSEDVSESDAVQTAEQCPQCAIRVQDTETGEILFPPPELMR